VVAASFGKDEVYNKSGKTTATIRIVTSQGTGPVYVRTAETLEHGALWEATLDNNAIAVTLNAGHPFYTKAYLPNKQNSPLVQALDYLLWSLANAELSNINDETRDAFEEFRVEVSRNLKKLVADLPDPEDSGS